MQIDPLTITVAAATFLLAGFVKGVVGLGLPTVAMGILTLVMPPAKAAALLVVPSFVTNIWQLAAGPSVGAIARRLWPMMAAVLLGTLLGAGFMQGAGATRATIGLGIALVVYSLLGLAAVRFSVPARSEPWLGPIVGLVTGLITAATGVFVIPAVPYLGALGLAKEELIQALGLSFTVSTVGLAASLALGGSLQAAVLGGSLAALAPAVLGMLVGGWVRGRVSEAAFRRCFFAGMLLLGAHLALKPFL